MQQTQITIAITGIDTGCGKSYITGLLGCFLLSQGKDVSTIKLVQTGCSGVAEDILTHRRLMRQPLSEEDKQGLSHPYVFNFPASPRLAARMEGRVIETERLDQAVLAMQARYPWLLVEGAGGLLVPFTSDMLLLDYLARHRWPLILVTGPRLGSINHTRLSLEAIRGRGLHLLGLAYNVHGEAPAEIVRDTLHECRLALQDYGFSETIALVPDVKESSAIAWQPLLAGLEQ